jgi:hypothetical protein
MGIIVYSKTDVYSKNLEERERTEFLRVNLALVPFIAGRRALQLETRVG